jgi:hypothetical protein
VEDFKNGSGFKFNLSKNHLLGITKEELVCQDFVQTRKVPLSLKSLGKKILKEKVPISFDVWASAHFCHWW